MLRFLKKAVLFVAPVVDLTLAPITIVASLWLKAIRRHGVHRLKVSKAVFDGVGVFPIRDHYYEPLFNRARLIRPLGDDRPLPGLDLNEAEQLSLLENFSYNDELIELPLERRADLEFYYHNGAFEPGDAEYLFNIIRSFKPSKIIEIGSGHSTLMAAYAIRKNREEDKGYQCLHVCIEPYEQPWLERLGVSVIRERVERMDRSVFRSLEAGDVLFIDSSHIIRPQGDVLCEYLEILPLLKPGVLVHVHDVFTPKDYPEDWVVDRVRLWNEQYLLEAFLSLNDQFRVIGALNYLFHHYTTALAAKCPILKNELASSEPGSFWIVRNDSK